MKLQQETLSNGLRVVLHPDSRLPLVTVNLWYHVGSKHERPGLTGFAHLFEHMLFQGSENVPVNDHFRLIQQVGGVANGSTWYDRTNYFETLPSSHLDLGLWLESDRMGFLLPAMTQDKLENQRSVVMNERRQRVDNQPYGQASERLNELLYPKDHPYHWPVIGYMEDIEAATLEDVSTFFETFYTPNNAVLTLAGDFDPQEAIDRVEHFFGDLPSGPPVPAPIASGAPNQPGQGQRVVLEDQISLPRVYLSHCVPGFGTPEWYSAQLLSEVLTGGKSSLLYEEFVLRRQMAQSIACYVLPTEECASFNVIATVRPEHDIEDLEKALTEKLQSYSTKLFDADLVEQAKSRLQAQHFNQLQTLDRRADMLSRAATFFGDPAWVLSSADRLAAPEPSDLQALALKHLGQHQRATVIVVPKGEVS